MIYLDNTQDLQEVWVPRNDGIKATRDDCFSSGYDSGYTDGFNDGRMSGASLQEKEVSISTEVTEIMPDEGYDGMSKVRIDAGKYGETMRGEGYQEGRDSVMEKIVPTAVTMAEMEATFVPGDGIAGFSSVAVDAFEYGIIQYRQGEEDGDAAGYERGFTEGQDDITSNITSTAFTKNGEYTATREAFARFYGGRLITSNKDNAVHALEMTVILYEGASGTLFDDNSDNRGDWGDIYQGIRAVSGTDHNLEFRDRGCTAVAAVSYGVPHTIRMSGADMSVDGVPLEVSGAVGGEPMSRSNLIGIDLDSAAVGKFRIWTEGFSGWDSGPYWEYGVTEDDYTSTFKWVWEEKTQERPNDAFQTYGANESSPKYMEHGSYAWSAVTVDVPTGETVNNQVKVIEITANTSTTVTYDSGYTGLEKVDIEVSVPTGETINNQTKTVTVSADTQTVSYDSGYTGLESVEIDAAEYGQERYEQGKAAVPLQEKSAVLTASVMEVLPDGGYSGMSRVSIDAAEYAQEKYQDGYDAGNEAGYESGHTEGYSEGQEAGKNEIMAGIEATAVTVTAATMTVSPDGGKYGFSKVDINASDYGDSRYQEGYESGHTAGYESGYTEGQENIISGIGTTAFTENGVYTALTSTAQYGWSSVTVNVPQTGTAINNQTKTVEITTNGTTEVIYDSGYTGLEKVKVNVNVPQSGGDVTVISLTQAEYDELDSPDPNAIYLITDGVIGCLDPNKFPFKDYPDLDYKSMDWVSVPQWIDFEGVIDISSKFRDMLSLTEAKIRSSTITTAVDTFNSDTNITDVYIDCPEMVDIRGMFNGDKEIRRAVFTSTKLHDVNVCLDWCNKLEYLEMGGIVNNPGGNRWDDYIIFMAGGGAALTGVTIGILPDYDLSQIGFSRCNYLTHDSLIGLLNALPQATGDYSFGIGGTNISKLSEDEIAIATDKGWSLV